MDIKELVRFLRKIRPSKNNKCLIWIGYINTTGYGSFQYKRKVIPSHRASYQLFHGNIPNEMLILHKCDNPRCVNPEHLYAGTYKNNSDDKYSRHRERHYHGQRNRNSKLSNKQVVRIKELLSKGVSCAEIGRKYKVAAEHISRIKHNKSRKIK